MVNKMHLPAHTRQNYAFSLVENVLGTIIHNGADSAVVTFLGHATCNLSHAVLQAFRAEPFSGIPNIGDEVSVKPEGLPGNLRYLSPDPRGTVTNPGIARCLLRFRDGNNQWLETRFLQKLIPEQFGPSGQDVPPSGESVPELLLLGFHKGDYVRAGLFGRGVVEALCPSDSANLMVKFGSFATSHNALVKSIAASELDSEETWQRRQADACRAKEATIAEAVRKASTEVASAAAAYAALEMQTDAKEKAVKKASAALTRASKGARELSIITHVKFRKKSGLPKAWRDISNHVELEWAVAVSTDAESDSKVLLTITDCKGLAKTVKSVPGPHIITAKGPKLHALAAGPRKPVSLTLGSALAKQILKKAKPTAAAPAQLHSFSLLKAALGALGDSVVLDPAVQAFFDSPENGIIRAKEVEAPSKVVEILRPYQLTGFQWLVNNTRNGLGCILADDMGLGKTIQAISLIMYMKQQGMLQKPILVVVPKGLLSNWSRELKRWAGEDLELHEYFGNQRSFLANAMPQDEAAAAAPEPPAKRRRVSGKKAPQESVAASASGSASGSAAASGSASGSAAASTDKPRRGPKARTSLGRKSADVFLTSYGTFRSDADKLIAGQRFSGMILDEAQQIKNYSSQISKAIKRMAEATGNIRISLSGTPVENRLADMHSQFEFILPGYLASSRTEFERDFGKPLAAAVKRGAASNQDVLEKQRLLQRMIQPFILRRMKTDPAIAADLPPKVEQTHDCELSEIQLKLYKAVQEATLQRALQTEGFGRHGQVLAMLHALREVCNHPTCLAEKRRPEQIPAADYPAADCIEESGKCTKLFEILEAAMQSQEKVLIFSNYLGTIDLLSSQIQQRFNSKVLKIVGSMDKDQREATVDSFQTDPACSVLLLSLQAGGVGLTLTAATHVIHFDRCYNPAKENQATDRAHRIGQNKTVFVHRLVTKDTFEERLGEIMEQKQQLSDLTVMSGEGWIADLGDAELRDLFSLGSKA